MNSNSAKRTRPALTREDLKVIQARSADSPDVRALLWEVARLRSLVLRTNDYFRQGSSSTALVLAEILQAELEVEPVINEQPKL